MGMNRETQTHGPHEPSTRRFKSESGSSQLHSKCHPMNVFLQWMLDAKVRTPDFLGSSSSKKLGQFGGDLGFYIWSHTWTALASTARVSRPMSGFSPAASGESKVPGHRQWWTLRNREHRTHGNLPEQPKQSPPIPNAPLCPSWDSGG